ncbi:hypothetical protein OAQ30_02590 [Nitrosopumilus sp.]|jgi:hypothetical protein|nr:hypothetical protein [Nitrosopumilus sp.]|tara:strand:- start:112 stop:363 length:252 start_codon:yes stop_codon:yes gene_type:complete
MLNTAKFWNKLTCVCKNIVMFEIIPEIECDWGHHTVIQCPKCEELFSIDIKCPAFQTIEKLWIENVELYTNEERFFYLEKSHH